MNVLLKLAFSLVLGHLFSMKFADAENGHLKIAAFNIQVFGTKKAANADIMKYIVKIIQRYDMILIQEIRDKSQTAMFKLLGKLKEADTPYRMHISKRLGRTSSKEQYAFLSRIGAGIRFEDSFTYEDGSEKNGTDTFQREPYVVRFSFENLPFKYISFIAIHADPGEAVSEIQQLTHVYEETVKRWDNKEIIIMGDLNADCSYVPKKSWSKIPLRSDSYYWPIDDSDDTTIAGTNCAYDRFIIGGEKLIESAKGGRASVFKFDAAYGLNETFTKLISDHYPIELDLPFTETRETNEIPPASAAVKSALPFKFSGNSYHSMISVHWMQCCILAVISFLKLIS